MIIVEGPDGSGKTTLAKLIADEFGIEYRRYSGLSSQTGPDEGIHSWWKDQIREDADAVYDRCFFISERMYQPATPGRPLMVPGEDMLQGIHRLWVIEPLIIFCLPPEGVAISNTLSDGRDRLLGVDALALRKIYWSYWGEYALWHLALDENVILYNYTNILDLDLITGWIKGKRHKPVRGKA